jgi:hypothetical protein
MSNSEAVNYAQVVCECPHRHLLGTIIGKIDLPRPNHWAYVGWADRPFSAGTTEVKDEPLTTGQKVKAPCEACRKEGRHGTNYQASWKSVSAKLGEALNTRAERVTLVFG